MFSYDNNTIPKQHFKKDLKDLLNKDFKNLIKQLIDPNQKLDITNYV